MTTTHTANAPYDDVTVVVSEPFVDSVTEPAPPLGRTTIPERGDGATGPRRTVRQATAEDRFNLWGALVAGVCVAVLLFGWFTPLTGQVGWAVVGFLSFIGLYALLVSLRSNRQDVSDRVMTVLLVSAAVILFGALVFVVLYAVFSGWDALWHLNFFTQTMQFAGPLDPLTVGGILHAIVGTLIQISIALAITVPLGITTAVFLNEVGGPFARFVRTITDAMTALPSIVAGLFVYTAIITLVTHQRSGFAAALAITVMMLPIVIRAADVVLRLVAGNLREASYALGSTRWRTVWHVVLPTARSGLVTAVILGTARGVGETSPVLLTSGVTAVMNFNPFSGPMISLPLQVFEFVRSSEPIQRARGFGTAAVLVLLVLTLFFIARLIGGKGPGQLSDRQRRKAADASKRDLQRMVRRGFPPAPPAPDAPPAATAPPESDASPIPPDPDQLSNTEETTP